MRHRILIAVVVLLTAGAAVAADDVVVEQWKPRLGATGVPPGWRPQNWGSPKYEFRVVEHDGRPALHMKSAGDGSTISRDVKGTIDLKATPVLEWSWIAPSGTVQAEGELVWWSYELDEAHAGELLRVAEGGLVEGCPPAPLPVLPRKGAGVNPGDASPSRLQDTFARVWTALDAYRPVACPLR